MGQDAGTTRFFPDPILTELTYRKKNTKSVAIKLLLPHLARAALACRDSRVRVGAAPTSGAASLLRARNLRARWWHGVLGAWGLGFSSGFFLFVF